MSIMHKCHFSSSYMDNIINNNNQIPGKTFKSDCWPGLENTRTYLRGTVREWNHSKGYGFITDDNESLLHMPKNKQAHYYFHWRDISGYNVPWLKIGTPVAFEVVEEDVDNKYGQYLPRSHMYQNDRPLFRGGFDTNSSVFSNNVRAINVHALNRVNWSQDTQQTFDEKEMAMDERNDKILDENEIQELIDPKNQYENISNEEVLKNVEYRARVRNRNKNRRGSDANEAELKSYSDLKKYPYEYSLDSEIPDKLLMKYKQWYPEIYSKYKMIENEEKRKHDRKCRIQKKLQYKSYVRHSHMTQMITSPKSK